MTTPRQWLFTIWHVLLIWFRALLRRFMHTHTGAHACVLSCYSWAKALWEGMDLLFTFWHIHYSRFLFSFFFFILSCLYCVCAYTHMCTCACSCTCICPCLSIYVEVRRQTQVLFLRGSPPFFWLGFSKAWNSLSRLSSLTMKPSYLCLSETDIIISTYHHAFSLKCNFCCLLHGFQGLNLEPHDCKVSILLAQLSLYPFVSLFNILNLRKAVLGSQQKGAEGTEISHMLRSYTHP